MNHEPHGCLQPALDHVVADTIGLISCEELSRPFFALRKDRWQWLACCSSHGLLFRLFPNAEFLFSCGASRS